MSLIASIRLRKRIIKSLALLISFIAIGLMLKLFLADDFLRSEQLTEFFKEQQNHVLLYFMLVGIAATAIGLPRQAIAFLAGFTFGFVEGVLLSTLATTLGCMLCFCYSKYLARDFILKRFQKKVIVIDDFVRQQPFIKTLIIRLLPIGSNLLTNLAMGLTDIKKSAFFLASFIGYLPQMIVFTLTGSGIRVDSSNQLLISIVLLVISLILGAWLFQKYRKTSYLSRSNFEN